MFSEVIRFTVLLSAIIRGIMKEALLKQESKTKRLAYSISEACEVANIGRTRLYEVINAGDLPVKKFGTKTLILAEDFNNWLSNLPDGGVQSAEAA